VLPYSTRLETQQRTSGGRLAADPRFMSTVNLEPSTPRGYPQGARLLEVMQAPLDVSISRFVPALLLAVLSKRLLGHKTSIPFPVMTLLASSSIPFHSLLDWRGALRSV